MDTKTRIDGGKPFLPELNLARALAIMAVIMVHATSSVTVDLDKQSSLYPVYNFLNIFFRVGTPTFIFLSSFVLFYSYADRDLSSKLLAKFYRNRVLYIFTPYFLFSIIYFALVLIFYHNISQINVADTLLSFLQKLATGKVYAHLYFVFVNLQFYIMFPAILWLFKTRPKLLVHAVWLGFAVQWLFFYLNHYFWHVPYKGSWAFTYFSYYCLGAYIGVYYQSVLDALRGFGKYLLWGAWLAAGAFHVYVYHMYRIYGKAWNTQIFELAWNAHTILTALVIFHAVFALYRRIPTLLRKTLGHLGAHSFGIYLLHPLILAVYRKVALPQGGEAWIYHLMVALGWAAALLISWFVVAWTFRLVPWAWMLFGSGPGKAKSERRPADSGSRPAASV
jgi:peptidoglycan/LPS O-acetylase OafA/YrhL